MKLLRYFGVLAAVGMCVALAALAAPALAQNRSNELERQDRALREMTVLPGRGAEIGVRITDRTEGGVVVEDVQPDSPAEKAGIKRTDVIMEFDGERVRSARQFERLVRETPPGRTVKATITHEGQRKDIEITPNEGRATTMIFDGDRMRERMGDLVGRIPNFDFDFDMLGPAAGRRLGVTVDELSPQLADYFGTTDGVLVTSVQEGSAGARAGLKAGDVIRSINSRRVADREDLVRGLRESNEEVTILIVRDKKERVVKATIETPRRPARGRPA
jgi:serine protease Do